MAIKVLCGVPNAYCNGGKIILNHSDAKAHSSHEEAFKCMARYLTRQGYERIGQREFRPPDGGYIKVLTKKSRYGARLRHGKSGETAKGKRWTFKRNTGGAIGDN